MFIVTEIGGYLLLLIIKMWKWSVVKEKHIKMKPRIYVLFMFITWTANANSVDHILNGICWREAAIIIIIIIIKQMCIAP